ncbi:MAG: PHB depolymerase family esterase [Permianibacter sp.]
MRVQLFVLALAAVLASGVAQAEAPLPKLNLASDITVSGLSSGGYMANQFHLAHAEQVHGVGILAGGPYDCAENNLATALARCVGKTDPALDVMTLLSKAKQRAVAGALAPVDSWARARVWLFHGKKDVTVSRMVTDQLATFYQAIVPAGQTQYVTDIEAAHSMPTRTKGSSCALSESPFISACQYDAAGALLNFLLGPLQPAVSKTSGVVLRFDQDVYAPNGDNTLADTGYLYLPAACAAGESCRLHIAFHGCQQNAEAIGERFVRDAGYNEWADSNKLVILYPQTKSTILPLNPKGCWDWWGYTGADYATRKGNQIVIVAAMVAALRR